jgi:hypothetical protein
MKLAESFKILTSSAPGTNSRALRAIGQDLADLFPETIEIKRYKERFFAQVRCSKERFDAKQAKPQRKGLKEFCADMLARDLSTFTQHAKPTIIQFDRAYAPEDIDEIDEIGMRRRFGVGKIPDIRSLPEMLRTIGRLVDGQEGELTKVCKDARRVVYEYTDRNGKLCNEIMSNVDLYRLQKSFYERRAATVGLDPWQKGK